MDPRINTAARLQQQKNYAAAEQIYRQILTTSPGNADALLLLGLLFHETGRNADAVEPLRKSALIQPRRPDTHQTLATVLQVLGRIHEAIAAAREVARLKPLDAEARYAVAQLMQQAGDSAGALPYARRAAELNPKAAAIFLCLSRIHLSLSDIPSATIAIDRALQIDPNHSDALVDKAHLLQATGRIDQAIPMFQAGLRLNPKNVAALNNLGSCFLMKVQVNDAIQCFEAAAALWPHSPKPRNNVGAALEQVGRIDQAIPHFLKAIEIDAAYADAHCNLGAAYASIAEQHRSIAAAREALRLKPDFAGVGSNLLLVMLSPTDFSNRQIFEEHLAWARRHAEAIQPLSPAPTSESLANRKIRIAYFSPDFREHSVRYFIEPVLAHHDRSAFEVTCYAAGRRRDEVTDRLAKLVDHWQPVAELTDAQLAQLIREQCIDILIDLAGHTSENRLLSFAYKPAPVQVTYLGYPTTTGLSQMDYRLTDSIADSITDPSESGNFYTEKLVRLPQSFFVYSDDPAKPFDPTLPVDRAGIFTFGSFNSFTKMNDETFSAWANILQAVPNSRLLFKAKPLENPSTRARVLSFFKQRNISADRLDLRTWVAMPEHVALLGGSVDLMLDTYPYNGHTTTCQAMWMGVPTVTRAGDNFRSRVGKTILHHLGLEDFVAKDWAEYESIAIRLATDLTRLRTVRPTLRDRMINSPLCDAPGFTRSLEAAYRAMLTPSA